MVCAPTNKAISGLATRFISEICPRGDEPDVGITVVGNYNKLSDGLGQNSNLRPFHLYQFLNVIKIDLTKVLAYTDQGMRSEESCSSCIHIVRRAKKRLKNRLKHLPPPVLVALGSLLTALEELEKSHASKGASMEQVRVACQEALRTLKLHTKKEDAVHKDLIASTNVFFCTLRTNRQQHREWQRRWDQLDG